MFNGNYIKIDTILYDIKKYPFTEGLTKREASHSLVKLLGLIGATVPLVKQYKNVQISMHKGAMPKGVVFIHGVSFKGDSCDNQGVPMRYASDIYNSVLHSDEAKKLCKGEKASVSDKSRGSYNINGMSIDIDKPYGWVEIAYDSIQMDEDGFPMIPDDASFKEAFKYFLLKNAAEPSFYRGDVNQAVFRDIETQYNWYVGQAFSSLTMLTPDQMETMANGLLRILPENSNFKDGWGNFNKPR